MNIESNTAIIIAIFHYFGAFFIGLFVIAIGLGIGAVLYRRYKTARENESNLQTFNRLKKESFWSRFFNGRWP